MFEGLLFLLYIIITPVALAAVVALLVLLAYAMYKSWLPLWLVFAATVGPVTILGFTQSPRFLAIPEGVAVGSLALAIRRLMVDFSDRIASNHSAFNQIARSNNGAADTIETGRLDGPVPLPPNARLWLAFMIICSIVVILWIPLGLFFELVFAGGHVPRAGADVYYAFIGGWGGANVTAVGVLIGIVVFVMPGRWIRGDQNAAQTRAQTRPEEIVIAIAIAAAVFFL
jgi:hypothetical protein